MLNVFKIWLRTPWIAMWAVAGAVFVGFKALTWLTWLARRRSGDGGHDVPVWRHAGYLLAWPGLDADAFLTRAPAAPPTGREWMIAAVKIVFGITLVDAGVLGATRVSPDRAYIPAWIGMIGFVLTLHFGLCHLLSCAWRSAGVDARPLMNRPLASTSVGEFWGRRWNTAFRDVTHRFLFRPLTPWLGTYGAIFAGFVFSGVIHDVVLSLPARGGYGGPTLFFLCQALALFAERSVVGRRLGLGHGLTGRVFTAATLLLPLYGLFHPPFVERIVVPFMKALGTV
jgi:Membrane bound O-acyl transferase family